MRLVQDFGDLTRTYRTATFTDCETQTFVASNRSDEFHVDSYVVTRHYHFYTFGESDFARYIKRTDVELRTVVVVERSVTTTFFFLQDINLSLEFRVGFYLSRVADYHTTFDFVLVDTTEQQTYVITSFTFVEDLTEHLNTSYNRFLVGAQTQDLYLVANFYATGFDTTRSNSTTTSNREYVLNRHQEGFINITRRQRNPSIYGIHQLHDFLFPFGFTVQGTEGRTTDDRCVVTIIFIGVEQLSHLHFNEFEHLFVVNHITFVQEYNDTGNVYLTSQQDVLTSLRHRTISCCNHDNCTIHLSSTGYHVLYIVGVSRAVNVCIVAICSFIFYVRSINRNTTLFFLRCVIDRVERAHFRKTFLCKYHRNGGGQGRFTVVYVTNSTNVYVGFGTLKLFFCHSFVFFIKLISVLKTWSR